MEHQKISTKPKNKILKFLPKATSSVSFQNPPVYSPSKDKKQSEKPHRSNLGIGSIIPSNNNSRNLNNNFTHTLVFEPTSPRVSCMGQVKCKHYRKLAAAAKTANNISRKTSFTQVKTLKNEEDDQEKVITKSKKKYGIQSLFGSRKRVDVNNESKTAANLTKAPSLGMMKRFSSGRDALSNFDWTTQVTPLDCGRTNNNYVVTDDGEEIIIPSSAPVMERNKGFCENFVVRGGNVNLEPRKEINLWKRRTMTKPMPLQLHAES